MPRRFMILSVKGASCDLGFCGGFGLSKARKPRWSGISSGSFAIAASIWAGWAGPFEMGARISRLGRASRTSAAPRASCAPSRISMLHPAARGSIGWPGTAMTSRPWSKARRAVPRLPERRAASTTTVAAQIPVIMRLRRGKSRACARYPGGRSETRRPAFAMS